ncbi:Rieske 2Fe-2S domain-containing protein [Actinomadura decatromicini]|nr:Rieske 2Fe-2S domain-containing protein [Actinomadura decatromicini]
MGTTERAAELDAGVDETGRVDETGGARPLRGGRWHVGYTQARHGLRNYWYPALFSHEIEDGTFRTRRMLGENILFNRVDGTVLAVADSCVHHMVRLSAKPGGAESHVPGTVTCWYHGFTYDMRTGDLTGVLTQPDCPLIGRAKIASYPVAERQGVVFAWIGDDEPGPLEADVPPGFLGEDHKVVGLRRTIASNWRLGAENGFDPTHIYFHREAPIVTGTSRRMPLGLNMVPGKEPEFVSAGGRRGLVDMLRENYEPLYEAEVNGSVVKATGTHRSTTEEGSIWLPGVLKITKFLPDPEMTHFEWYVPIDEDRHDYVQMLVRPCANADEEKDFVAQYHGMWEQMFHRDGFNDQDIWARCALQEVFANEDEWSSEQLMKPDMALIHWRRLVHGHARGFQGPPRFAAPKDSVD